MVIKAEDEIFFNTIQVINTSGAAAISANLVRLIARIMKKSPDLAIIQKNNSKNR